MKSLKNLCLFLAVLVFLFSCRKESFTSDPSSHLRATADTIHFDTVFTTTGSVSQVVKIVNDNNKSIRVSSVRLFGGNASAFRINADGVPGPLINNLEVAANDSFYIFVTVSVNPTAANNAFIIRDSIEISYNGNRDIVQLDAYGQNAHFFKNRKITGSEIWNNDLPYVILGRLTIDTNAVLTINKGCRIFIHADAPVIVNGSLRVNGDKYDSTRVVFRGNPVTRWLK